MMPSRLPALTETTFLDLPRFRSGKVREVYDLGHALLMVATDRISAFDCILPTPIPDKGRVLTALSAFWFNHLGHIAPHHVLSCNPDDFPAVVQPYRDHLAGRTMLVRKTTPLPVECVARGYLAGSGWKDYQRTGRVCGLALPPGLREADQLPEPLFTPATKAETGHDENISLEQMADRIGIELTQRLKAVTLELYAAAAAYARTRGLILCDTKFEFGLDPDGQLVWIDEALTPDSSRYWDAASYAPGRSPASFDKQFVRDYLETLDWNKQPPAPPLPDDITEATRRRYWEAYHRLVGD
ncbi:phosphoribosylaminoimidazolesuccinocarboxamide synthase [Chloracidobacterium validum]|uniref:Phosphoribosylaminoimidazole-succinocarboxamide synthase n=1 Tax=Chloracidobacterium validum TaxID=2821543 RepID=A0ABX8B911_9BACT|nr:phosphoribosylaminoimidazolesuccinocarboxamide synthase [Chloracidobacterium validum]QUW03154.1 phosphoribosylaminoimidazolesuccinocarboxamide synthase [Chloracidobacterium validum]